MGLLDDAIREHLELKRLRGADPDEVARLEREALGPPHRRNEAALEEPPRADDLDDLEDGAPEARSGERIEDFDPLADHDADDIDEIQPRHTVATTAQDTEEVDMEAELHADLPDARPPLHDGDAGNDEEPREPGAGEPGDNGDVLQETPDFLQEAPEHDRLWFEQRPPRDFDFDK